MRLARARMELRRRLEVKRVLEPGLGLKTGLAPRLMPDLGLALGFLSRALDQIKSGVIHPLMPLRVNMAGIFGIRSRPDTIKQAMRRKHDILSPHRQTA